MEISANNSISPPQEVRPEFLGSCLTSTCPLSNESRLIAWRFKAAIHRTPHGYRDLLRLKERLFARAIAQ